MAALTISKEEEQRLKGLGFLNNKGTDNFSARVITVNGKVTVAQHRYLADAAEKFGNGNLTFTTRLTVEVQGIPYENIDAFQEYLAKEGLDIPRLDRLFLVSPQKDYAVVTQSVGRIARKADGKTDAVCYDYVDDIQFCENQFKRRKTHYRKAGCIL